MKIIDISMHFKQKLHEQEMLSNNKIGGGGLGYQNQGGVAHHN